MGHRRIERVNSLIREVISEVIRKDVKHPDVSEMVTISRVETSKDLRHAKVFVSQLGSDEEKQKTLDALQSSAGFIAVKASKKVVMRYFPELLFRLDHSVDNVIKIDTLLSEIHTEQEQRDRGQQESHE